MKAFFKQFWCWLTTRHYKAEDVDSFSGGYFYKCPCGADFLDDCNQSDRQKILHRRGYAGFEPQRHTPDAGE